ncbi:MAG: LemA family protein [Candidatus Omnitrophica bacterium]|nr:LemA family protein [Candidatus Omnitrophota bacterium]
MSLISDSVKKLFPSELGELTPKRIHWWQKIDFSNLGSREGVLAGIFMLVVLLSGIYYYNHFVNLSRFTEMEQNQIEVQLQRKRNLAINLAKMVIAYAEHERTMYQYMADKRAGSMDKTEMIMNMLKQGGLTDLANMKPEHVEGALSKFMALAEAYPDLKLSDNFQKLMDALIVSEDRIAASRMEYNKAASVFHTAVKNFPGCLYAWVFGYKEKMFHYAAVDKDISGEAIEVVPYRVFSNPDDLRYEHRRPMADRQTEPVASVGSVAPVGQVNAVNEAK